MYNFYVFGGVEAANTDFDGSLITILPVPYDGTSTYLKGADKGPAALIEASSFLEFYDIETDSEVYKKGIHTVPSLSVNDLSPEDMVDLVYKKTAELIDKDKFVVLLGGEHSVSIGSIRAHQEKYGNISVLHLDAHADTRDEYEGSKYNHACVMARSAEICDHVSVGIRSMDISEKGKLPEEKMFFAKDILPRHLGRKTNSDWMDEVAGRLKDKVYVTIDFDVFDPSVMPSTGTPEPGGLLWYDVIGLLRKVSGKRQIIGFDCVELLPYSGNTAPDFMAAKLVYKLLSYVYRV